MSDTPQTDAAFSAKRTFPAGIVELQDFARQLERERNAWRECAARLAGELQFYADTMGPNFTADGDRALAEFDKLKGKPL